MKIRMDDMNFVLDTVKKAADGTYGDSCFFGKDEKDILTAVSLIDTTKIGLIKVSNCQSYEDIINKAGLKRKIHVHTCKWRKSYNIKKVCF